MIPLRISRVRALKSCSIGKKIQNEQNSLIAKEAQESLLELMRGPTNTAGMNDPENLSPVGLIRDA